MVLRPTFGYGPGCWICTLAAFNFQLILQRLLPAFNTDTGIPVSRINLLYGVLPGEEQATCSACAGTLVLEFGLLSRLTSNPIFEVAWAFLPTYLQWPGNNIWCSQKNMGEEITSRLTWKHH